MTMEMTTRPCAVVTGASRGIGAAIARALASDGYSLVLGCRDSLKAEAVADDCRALGADVLIVQGDLADQDVCERFAAEAIERFGQIDLLVNNAGIARDGLLVRMKTDQWDNVLATNLTATFHMMRQITPHMFKARRGKIINITSVAGISGNMGQANYAASKAGVIGLTKSAAKELGSRGITVNAVAPGFVETDMTCQLDEKYMSAAMERISLRRMGQPEEIAAVVSFLASDRASYITGQVISVDGGLVL